MATNTIDLLLTDYTPAPPALDNDGHDLDISTGDLQTVSGVEMVTQSLVIALWWFVGEWKFDTSQGTDWYSILGEKYRASEVEAKVKNTIMSMADVNKILSYSQIFDNSNRKLAITFTVDTAYGIAEVSI